MTVPAAWYSAYSGTVNGISGQTKVIDVLAPRLEVRREHRRDEVKPKPIFPDAKERDCRENRRPNHEGKGKLEPDSASHFLAADQRVGIEENPQENERRIEQADGQLQKRSETARPTRRFRENERPEFGVLLGGEMDVMHLVHNPVETERKKTENADEHTVEFIQAPALSEQTVRSFVKADQQSVHNMRGDEDQRDG